MHILFGCENKNPEKKNENKKSAQHQPKRNVHSENILLLFLINFKWTKWWRPRRRRRWEKYWFMSNTMLHFIYIFDILFSSFAAVAAVVVFLLLSVQQILYCFSRIVAQRNRWGWFLCIFFSSSSSSILSQIFIFFNVETCVFPSFSISHSFPFSFWLHLSANKSQSTEMNDSRKIYGSRERCTSAFDLVSFVCPGNTWTDWMYVRKISNSVCTSSAIEWRERERETDEHDWFRIRKM